MMIFNTSQFDTQAGYLIARTNRNTPTSYVGWEYWCADGTWGKEGYLFPTRAAAQEQLDKLRAAAVPEAVTGTA